MYYFRTKQYEIKLFINEGSLLKIYLPQLRHDFWLIVPAVFGVSKYLCHFTGWHFAWISVKGFEEGGGLYKIGTLSFPKKLTIFFESFNFNI